MSETGLTLSMFVDSRNVHHGQLSCTWEPDQTFDCENCERTVCYCGGHTRRAPDATYWHRRWRSHIRCSRRLRRT